MTMKKNIVEVWKKKPHSIRKGLVVKIENKITEFLLYLEKNSEKDFSRWLTGVNIFEILGITSAEIRHSRVLAWLLDPRESHKLEDKFFKKILMKVFDNNLSFETIKPTEIILMFCIQIKNIE